MSPILLMKYESSYFAKKAHLRISGLTLSILAVAICLLYSLQK